MAGKAARVLVVEDHAGTREALCTGLRLGGVEVCGDYGSGEAALAHAVAARPDVALVDLGLPGLSGAQTIRCLRALLPELHVLVLSVFEEESRIIEAIEAGAEGYLLKETAIGEVRRAVEQVREGLAPLAPEVARFVLRRLRDSNPKHGDAPHVSEREREILTMLARGHSYASVANALELKVGTIQTHVKNIYRKLEVCSKAEAASVAIRNGLIGI